MKEITQILEASLLTQLSLEEHLYKEVELQLSQSNIDEYPGVKEMLNSIKRVLEKHYSRLNLALEQVERTAAQFALSEQKEQRANEINKLSGETLGIRSLHVSQMLHDDFAALNLAAIGNTLLHTTALAAESQVIADLALEHLENLSRFVVNLSELLPRVVGRELSFQFPEVKPIVGDLAAKNTQGVWRKPKEIPV